MSADKACKIIVALDDMNLEEVVNFAQRARGLAGTLKVHDFLDRNSSASVTFLKDLGFKVWPDLKLLEPPNKIQGRMAPYVERGADFLTISCFAWEKSMRAAAVVKQNTKLLGVGILSHLDEQDAREMLGFPVIAKPRYSVIRALTQRFALKAAECGLDGMVCAPAELKYLAELNLPSSFIKVVTNVRPHGVRLAGDDQNLQRSATPRRALEMGADYIVVGSPITKSKDPIAALREILIEIS